MKKELRWVGNVFIAGESFKNDSGKTYIEFMNKDNGEILYTEAPDTYADGVKVKVGDKCERFASGKIFKQRKARISKKAWKKWVDKVSELVKDL